MKRLMPTASTLAFAVPAAALPLTFLAASALVLNAPAPERPLAAIDSAAEEDPDAPIPRLYLPFIAPVHVTLPEGGGLLKLELTAALRADLDAATQKMLKEAPEPVLAVAADAVLDTAETLEPGDLVALRRALPEALARAMNARLTPEETGGDASGTGEEEEAPAPILEILITEWGHAP
ncbi:hypothetical protein [Roseovarius aquimarinus]|uniref:Uncharacterized protein n=1 Tax=Roseovarius aquimarinus TaxID=1229156 RepID=A0ABW7I5A1_9RHOB